MSQSSGGAEERAELERLMRLDAELTARQLALQGTASSIMTVAVQIQKADRGADRLHRRLQRRIAGL